MKIEDLKSKIIKYNTYSTIIIITIIILFSFFITYFTIKKKLRKRDKINKTKLHPKPKRSHEKPSKQCN